MFPLYSIIRTYRMLTVRTEKILHVPIRFVV
jgi:hypothetical protein